MRLEVCDGTKEASPVVGNAYVSTGRRTLSTTFDYSHMYLADPAAWPLSPDLPLVGQSVTAGLPGALADSTPDRWGRNLIDRRIRGEALAAGRTPPTVTDVDYLLGVSDLTRQGALRYRQRDVAPFLAESSEVPRLVDLPHLLNAADELERRGGDDLGPVKELLAAGSASLGGARPKASVSDGDRLLLAKFPHASDEWDVMAWEALALDLAEASGIEVPAHDLVEFGGRNVLLVERFDREGGRRIPFISGMTLVGKRDGENADYIEVAEAISEHGVRVEEQLAQMFRRIVFSVLIHNTDDHLRNHGFLREGPGWQLSPVFDVNANPDIAQRRTTTIAWVDGAAGESAALLRIAPSFGFSPEQGGAVVDEVRDGVSGWRAVAAARGISANEVARFAPVLDRRG